MRDVHGKAAATGSRRAKSSGAIDGSGAIDVREDGVLIASTRAQGSIVSENGDIKGGKASVGLDRGVPKTLGRHDEGGVTATDCASRFAAR